MGEGSGGNGEVAVTVGRAGTVGPTVTLGGRPGVAEASTTGVGIGVAVAGGRVGRASSVTGVAVGTSVGTSVGTMVGRSVGTAVGATVVEGTTAVGGISVGGGGGGGG